MCGIAIVATTGRPVPAKMVSQLFDLIAPRGYDACGAAYYQPDEGWTTAVRRGPVTEQANRTALLQPVTELQPRAVLLHVRAATHGSPKDPANNHPVRGEHSIMIHNGIVRVPYEYDALGLTDTEQMLRHLETFGVEDGLATVQGMYAFGMVDLDQPDQIIVTRNYSAPLYQLDMPGGTVYSSCPMHAVGVRSVAVDPLKITRLLLEEGDLRKVTFDPHAQYRTVKNA